MLKFDRFSGLLFSMSLLISFQSPLALGQGFSGQQSDISSPPTPVRPILRNGSQGNAVSELQAALKLWGYYKGIVDGNYSESTATAVSVFQQAAGLNADGVVGRATWEKLFPPSVSNSTATIASSPATDRTTTNSTNSTVTAAEQSSSQDLPTLKLGMRGPEVFWLQKRLQTARFFRGSVDGIFGPETEVAVKAAQSQYGLNADGIVGPTTWQALLR